MPVDWITRSSVNWPRQSDAKMATGEILYHMCDSQKINCNGNDQQPGKTETLDALSNVQCWWGIHCELACVCRLIRMNQLDASMKLQRRSSKEAVCWAMRWVHDCRFFGSELCFGGSQSEALWHTGVSKKKSFLRKTYREGYQVVPRLIQQTYTN